MRWRWHRDMTAPPWLLSLSLQLLLLLLLQPDFSQQETDHACPPISVSRSACRDDGLLTVVTKHFEWNADLKRCQKKLQLTEESCDKTKATKGICPEPRTVEPGRCNPKSNRVKTLVLHYEPDGKGGCILRRDYAYPICPDKNKADDNRECPEPRYFQKPCSGKYRQVFKFYYEWSGSKNCVEKSAITLEACGIFVPAKECPSAKEIEPGPCKEGFRTLIRIEYDRDPAGKCVSRSRYVTQACNTAKTGDSTTESGCPPNVMKEAQCVNGLQSITKQYYEKTKTGECVRKFSIENKPCGKHKSGVCPNPRVMEPGPCVDGHTKVLVSHYEPDPVTGKCREQRSYTTKICGQSVDGGKSGSGENREERCPEKSYTQGPCREGYRNVFTFTYGYSETLKRCLKHVALNKEQCAALVKKEACPAEDTVESGPCNGGFRTNIVYHYSRNTEGQCVKSTKKATIACKTKPSSDCPSKTERKIGSCTESIQRYIITYYEFSNLKGRCIKKFKAAEKACKGGDSSHGSVGSDKEKESGAETGRSSSKKKLCPKRRVVEPGPCENGQHKVLIEHYEYDEKQGRCVARRDFVNKPCGKAAKKTQITPGIDLKHPCAGQKITQGPCRPEGYRTVTTEYYQYVIGLRRCVKKMKQEEEKCALLVKNTTCPADVTEETGPCTNGFRTDIVFSYVRDADGRCERKSKKVTMKC